MENVKNDLIRESRENVNVAIVLYMLLSLTSTFSIPHYLLSFFEEILLSLLIIFGILILLTRICII